MQQIQYTGEHLWIQYLGYGLIILAFVSALYTSLTSFLSRRQDDTDVKVAMERWSRYGLQFHAVSLFSVIGLILYMMNAHYFEFHYVWEHVSDDLPVKYILSAFWEGQEGSFLLWMFWNIVLCALLWRRRDEFTFLNTGIIMSVQAILLTMILGVYFFDYRLGSNPFLLLRQSMDIPLFKNPDYVSLIKGNGLNPLLQNYWMLIHPPTLFLGFASTILPFAYALSGLISKKYLDWLRPSLQWSLFAASILGLGILMGGIWAYEALSFGGYWAWDPVENMSLVPWLVLIAGIHAHLIARSTPYSVRSVFVFYFLSFALVIYSTYLTRSGVLGDSSVHAFTSLGLGWQLVGFILLSLSVPLYFLLKKRKEIATPSEEEQFSSREFWMFIGSLILLFSAVLITFTTSIPVYNKLLDLAGGLINQDFKSWHRSASVDVVSHHNRFQIWIAVIIGFLSGLTQFLRYADQRKIKLGWKQITPVIISAVAAMMITGISAQWLNKTFTSLYVMLFAAWFAIFCNVYYLFTLKLGGAKHWGSGIAHAGFGILLLGIISTGINRRNLVPERFFQEDSVFQDNKDNVDKHFLLFRGETKFVSGYQIDYLSDTLEARFRKYHITLKSQDSLGNENFIALNPDVQYDNKMMEVAAANPYIKHYWDHDLFSLVAQIPRIQMDAEEASKAEDSLRYHHYVAGVGDTIDGERHRFVINASDTGWRSHEVPMSEGDLGLQLRMVAIDKADTARNALLAPSLVLKSSTAYRFPSNDGRLGLRIEISDSVAYRLAEERNRFKPVQFRLKPGQSIELAKDLKVKLTGFDKNPQSEDYQAISGDIAVAAVLEVEQDGRLSIMKPIYLIRGREELPLPSMDLRRGLRMFFEHIDPETETMDFSYSRFELPKRFPLRIAENVPRTDYIVMEIIHFPGINLVWIGSLLMVAGLAWASYQRKK